MIRFSDYPHSNNIGPAEFIPPPTAEAHFDSSIGAWILTRHVDVSAALRDQGLAQASPKGDHLPEIEEATRSPSLARLKLEMADIHADRWRDDMRNEARAIVRTLAGRKQIDLIRDFVRPWSIAMLIKISGARAPWTTSVARIANSLLYRKVAKLNINESEKPDWLRAIEHDIEAAPDPELELDVLLESERLLISKMMFHAVAQSLPAFLAKSWLALLVNPGQMELLENDLTLLTHASHELLRYAGIVHTLHRKALRSLQLGGASICKGDWVQLKVASANFDSEVFPDPNQFNLARDSRPHLTLGAGPHACSGAAFVRQAVAETASAILALQPSLVGGQRVMWMGDSTLRWPLAVWVECNS